MSAKVFGKLQKMIKDIEAGRGDVKAAIKPIGTEEFITARQLLIDYADQYSFGSHDALVAATVLVANTKGIELTLVTSDKGLKAVCSAKSLPVFDPKN
jgi:predicted nucleic acid-binding protein